MTKPITVYVGGAPYPAELVEGVLRFKANWAVKAAADYVRREADLNALALKYLTEKLSLREYAEYQMLIGYSLSGFCDLSTFADLEVRTPSWTREGRTPWKEKGAPGKPR